MHIFIDRNIENIPLTVAQKLVNEFVRENPAALTDTFIDAIITDLSKKILYCESSCESSTLNKSNVRQIDISLDILPAVMKTWASTKSVFNIESDKTGRNELKVAPYTYANTDWSDVEVVLTAKEGQRGAWFFSNAERGSVVVKGQEGGDKQVMGAVFLRMMGMNAPDTKLVDRNSQEGRQLSELGQSAGLNSRSAPHYVVMDRVMGPSYKNLSSNDIAIVEKNLELIGELAIYDLVLGNFDRFQHDGTSFNAGNIMFQETILQAIDTDCVFDPEREGFTKLVLKKIIEKRSDLSSKLAQKLGTNLGTGVDPENFSTIKITNGMNKAIEKLLDKAKNLEATKKQYLDSCAQRGVSDINFPEHVENYLQHILSCNKNYRG